VVLSSFFWPNRVFILRDVADKQLEYLQWGGYCAVLSGLFFFKKGNPLGLRNFSAYLLIVTILFMSTLPFPTPPSSTPQSEILYESSSSQLDSLSLSDFSSLADFLQSRGLGNDKTLFVTIASKQYVDPMINLKYALDMWGLGEQYVVLCLDHECVHGAESHKIHAYTRYLMNAKEDGDDWHTLVARIKVCQISSVLTRV
jgi:hypothetical protein